MFGLFQDTTPAYAGEGQPNAYNGNRGGGGLLGGLFSLSSTPKYASASANTAQTSPPVALPSQGECAGSGEQLPAQTECRVPLPCAIVIQRSDNEGIAIALTKLSGDQVATQ